MPSPSSSSVHELLKPDGYYSYLKIPKPPTSNIKSTFGTSSNESNIDADQVEKNYRKLSLKHHPDKPGGDAETFRLLSRAKTVLLNDKLRKEYDVLGLDLEEEEDQHDNQDEQMDDDSSDGSETHSNSDKNGREKKHSSGNSSDSVIGRMASGALAGLLQTAIRTALMGFISTILSRYKYLVAIGICFMIHTSYKLFSLYRSYYKSPKQQQPQLVTKSDFVSPLLIGLGFYLMYIGRINEKRTFFFFGECIVMTLFMVNSITPADSISTFWRPSAAIITALAILSSLISLYVRGNFWKYTTIVLIILGLSILIALVCPMMEMILEEIMMQKIRKVGEKVRQYSLIVEEEVNQNKILIAQLQSKIQNSVVDSNHERNNESNFHDSNMDID